MVSRISSLPKKDLISKAISILYYVKCVRKNFRLYILVKLS